MPTGSYKHRAWCARTLLTLMALLALGTAGCLDCEKQTLVVVFHPKLNEARMLLAYEDLQVGGKGKSDLSSAEDALACSFKDRQAFFLGFNLFRVDLRDKADAFTPVEKKKTLEFLRRHLAIPEARLFLNKKGKLCGSQTVVVRNLKEFVDGLNERISKEFAKEAAAGLANPKQRSKAWDDKSLRLVQKAAGSGYAWLRMDDGRISYRMPGTPAFFRAIKGELLKTTFLNGIRDAVEVSKPAEPGKTGAKSRPIDPTAARHAVKNIETVVRILSDTAWSAEQRPNRITFVLGAGEGEPIRLTTEKYFQEPAKFEDQLLAKAKSMFPELEKRVEIEDVVARFLEDNHVTSPEP